MSLQFGQEVPITLPQFPILGLASEGVWGLTLGYDDAIVIGHTLPERTIFKATFKGFAMSDMQNLLTPQLFPTNDQGQQVTGYENPYYISSSHNALVEGEMGMLCTQLYGENGSAIVYTNLEATAAPRTLLSIDDLLGAGLITTTEGAFLGKAVLFADLVLFNYVGQNRYYADPISSIGVCDLKNGQVSNIQELWLSSEAFERGGIGLADAPIYLDGKLYLLVNRCSGYGGEAVWGIGYAEILLEENRLLIKERFFDELWLVPAEDDPHMATGQYAGRRVAIGSFFSTHGGAMKARCELFASSAPNKVSVVFLV
ncbi:MAG TPA: hypothetical protein VNG90_01330 [Candidatus Acidoferrum sp.]|nr:hypothetical protein [Candidatus Acidoferrum sp.]